MKYQSILLLVLCFKTLTMLTAQSPAGYFTALTTDNSLTENHVNCIYQDKDGFLWFGTFDGLNRFDGYTVETYKPAPNDSSSLSSILIYTIIGDGAGNLWIGTSGGGVSYYDAETETFTTFRASADDPYSLNSDNIQSIFIDRRQRLWVATYRGVNMLDLTDWQPGEPARFRSYFRGAATTDYQVRDMFEDRRGNIWFGTGQGLFRMEGGATKTPVPILQPDGSSFDIVECITELPDGNLCFGGAYGAYVETKRSGTYQQLTAAQTNSLAIDSTGRGLWVGTRNGLQRYRLGPDTVSLLANYVNDPTDHHSLTNNTIQDLYTDARGGLWIGTFGGGLNYYDPNRKNFGLLQAGKGKNSLTSNSVRSISQDEKGRIWLGTIGGGTNVTDGPLSLQTSPTIRHLSSPSRVYVTLEVKTEDNHYVYLGTDTVSGLYRVDLLRADWPVEPLPEISDAVFAMHEDSRGFLWFGTYWGGLHRWIPDATQPSGYRTKNFVSNAEVENLPINIVRSITEDQRGNIWVGTGAGLVRIDARGIGGDDPNFTTYQHQPGDETSLSHNYVLSLRAAP
ncbi:MAG: two-component regulator propeller domain-containing protein, partial [Bacteroidota bacterium]